MQRMSLRHVVRSVGGDDQHGQVGDAPREPAQQVEAADVGPVQVLQHQHQRLAVAAAASRLRTWANNAVWLVAPTRPATSPSDGPVAGDSRSRISLQGPYGGVSVRS